MENARLYTVAVEKGRLERELQMAREIQESLLPRQMPQVAHYQVAARWESAREVAGDFYDAFELGDDRFGIVIADVSDKGAPAALFMAVARTMMRAHSFAGLSPIETVSRTNDLILDDADSGMFVTVYHSVFEPNGRSIHINAGHNPPIYYRTTTKELFFMSRGGRAVGWFPENPLHQTDMQLEPGDLLVYYTDGVTEAQSTKGEFFGEDRLAEIVQRCSDYSPQALTDEIVREVDEFAKGMPPFDDQTLVVVRYTG